MNLKQFIFLLIFPIWAILIAVVTLSHALWVWIKLYVKTIEEYWQHYHHLGGVQQ